MSETPALDPAALRILNGHLSGAIGDCDCGAADVVGLPRIADELEVVAGEMREMDPDPGRWTGLAEGIRHLRARADRYDGGAA